jgi:hypothetical protein
MAGRFPKPPPVPHRALFRWRFCHDGGRDKEAGKPLVLLALVCVQGIYYPAEFRVIRAEICAIKE